MPYWCIDLAYHMIVSYYCILLHSPTQVATRHMWKPQLVVVFKRRAENKLAK